MLLFEPIYSHSDPATSSFHGLASTPSDSDPKARYPSFEDTPLLPFSSTSSPTSSAIHPGYPYSSSPFMSSTANYDWQDLTGLYNAQAAFQDFSTQQDPQHQSFSNGGEWSQDSVASAAQFYQQSQPRFTGAYIHRRAPSNSSVGTFDSTSSPYSGPSPAPASLQQQYQQQQFLFAPQHYPTPIHSPIHDAYSMASATGGGGSGSSSSSIGNKKRSNQGKHAAPQQPLSSAIRPDSSQPAYGAQQQELPVTPQTVAGIEEYQTQQHASAGITSGAFGGVATSRPPKFDRTMTDIYQDELYDPTQQFTLAAEQPPLPPNFNTTFLSPNRQVQQAVNAANQARSVSPRDDEQMRAVSPFRKGSEFFPGNRQIQTAAGNRQQQKAEADRIAFQQHHGLTRQQSDQSTISPKDAVLDYGAAEDKPSLFPPAMNEASSATIGNAQVPQYGPHKANNPRRSRPTSGFQFQTPVFPASASSSSGHPALPESSGSQDQTPLEFPAHLVSMETTKSEPDPDSSQEPIVHRPADTTAHTGTYTCTYHGCTQRFESPAALQKHKREGHRSTAQGSAASPAEDSAGEGSSSMTQAGPHRCERINPQTGKPCNTVFSRPYDLTRHEDTIHNRQKTKVRCPYCTEEKTFSRNDALTRHLKVVHPQVPIPGKQRRG